MKDENSKLPAAALDAARDAARPSGNALALLRATFGVTTDGLLVTDGAGRATEWNDRFAALWRLPEELLRARSRSRLLDAMAGQARDAQAFLARVEAIEGGAPCEAVDLLELADGRVFERTTRPIDTAGGGAGRVWSFRDVTERRLAEERLRRSEADLKRFAETESRLATIVQCSDDAIISKSLDGTVRSWNTGAERIFGYTAEEMIGRSILLLIPADRTREEAEIVARMARGERIDHYETVRIAKGGRRLHVSISVSPIRDAAGRVVGASKIARDVTAQREAEQARRQSEEQFRQLADALPQIVWSARPDGVLEYCNDRWFEFVGAKRGDPGAQSWRPILHPDDLLRSMEVWDGCIRSGNLFQIEYRFRDRRTGGYRWFLARAFPMRDDDGRIVRWIGTCTDIDDTKATEERTRFLADASGELAVLTDYRTTLQKVAGLSVPYFADWCAVDVQEADGSIRRVAVAHRDPARVALAHELFRRHPPQPGDAHGVARVLRSGESEWVPFIPDALQAAPVQDEEQARMARELGLKSYICTPLRSRRGTLGALTFATAESGRVFDANDVAAAEDLASRAAIAIDNAHLLATLKESDRRKDEFLAMLAHELRNPLAPIRNSVQIFRAHGMPVPDLQWATEVIDRQVRQMTRLVDDLLDVSRITRGRIELRRQPVDLAEVVASAVEASRPLIDKRRHELTVTIPAQPIRLDADPTRLAQVLSNLLNNAAKYMDPCGRIGLAASQEGGDVVISVRDTGIGIKKEVLPRIFDMFMQGDPGSEQSEGGLGIGLTLVRRLVELHGGSVEARSDGLGKGSEFRVRIPAAGAAEGATARRPEVQAASAAPRRILVVDDNHDAADTLRLLLKKTGNEVNTAHDGIEAVDVAESFRPEIVLLDLGLPKLSGYEAARRIRAQAGGDEMVLVALTGWGHEEDRRRSLEAGFDVHMTKPVEFTALRRLVADFEALRASRARQRKT
ncbi:MAG TPA: PAS domain S-box protein [Planctomycetota bacterium]|jgi:PAS domain S-box-containing protein|nr:PAS domain S-box protein [Planctomycetota bacterium]